MSNEWKDWYEIVNHFTGRAEAVVYYQRPDKPKKQNDESNAAYGLRLDTYEADLVKVQEQNKAADKLRQGFYNKLEDEIFQWFELDRTDPKVQKAWSIAWEHGHSAGYTEVISFFEDLLPLIK